MLRISRLTFDAGPSAIVRLIRSKGTEHYWRMLATHADKMSLGLCGSLNRSRRVADYGTTRIAVMTTGGSGVCTRSPLRLAVGDCEILSADVEAFGHLAEDAVAVLVGRDRPDGRAAGASARLMKNCDVALSKAAGSRVMAIVPRTFLRPLWASLRMAVRAGFGGGRSRSRRQRSSCPGRQSGQSCRRKILPWRS